MRGEAARSSPNAARPAVAGAGRASRRASPSSTRRRYPRNKFLEVSTLGLGAAIGGIVTLPMLGFAVLPAFIDQEPDDIDLGPLENFPEGQ